MSMSNYFDNLPEDIAGISDRIDQLMGETLESDSPSCGMQWSSSVAIRARDYARC